MAVKMAEHGVPNTETQGSGDDLNTAQHEGREVELTGVQFCKVRAHVSEGIGEG